MARKKENAWKKEDQDLVGCCVTCSEVTALKLSMNTINGLGDDERNCLEIFAGGSAGCVSLWKWDGCVWKEMNIGNHGQRVVSLCSLRNGDLVSAGIKGDMIYWRRGERDWSTKKIGVHEGVKDIKLLRDGNMISVSGQGDCVCWSNID